MDNSTWRVSHRLRRESGPVQQVQQSCKTLRSESHRSMATCCTCCTVGAGVLREEVIEFTPCHPCWSSRSTLPSVSATTQHCGGGSSSSRVTNLSSAGMSAMSKTSSRSAPKSSAGRRVEGAVRPCKGLALGPPDRRRRRDVNRWLRTDHPDSFLPAHLPMLNARRAKLLEAQRSPCMLAPRLTETTDCQITPSVDLHLWHSFGQGRLRVSGTARAKPVHGPSEPWSKREKGAADDDETDRDGTSSRWPRAHYRLVVSVRWCILKSVWGRNLTTNSECYQIDSSAKTLQVWATESASIVSLT